MFRFHVHSLVHRFTKKRGQEDTSVEVKILVVFLVQILSQSLFACFTHMKNFFPQLISFRKQERYFRIYMKEKLKMFPRWKLLKFCDAS